MKMVDTVEIMASSSFAYRVHDNLWIGNAPSIKSMHESTIDPINPYFSTLVLCAREYQPDGGLFTVGEVIHAPMDDAFVPVTRQTAFMAAETAKKVVACLENRKKVLVTCLAGRNRSGMVCALALCFGKSRMSADSAIRLVKEARGDHALANPFFVKFIETVVAG